MKPNDPYGINYGRLILALSVAIGIILIGML